MVLDICNLECFVVFERFIEKTIKIREALAGYPVLLISIVGLKKT